MFKAANNAQSTLAQAITATATSFSVVDGSSFPADNFLLTIDDEIVLVGTRSGNTLSSVTRGYESTTAAAHESGAAVENRFTAGTYTQLADALVEHKNEKATQTELGHVKVDGRTIFINEDGEISVNNPYPHDLSGSPGSKFLIAGTMEEGFFGEVPASELITGDALASACGISAGTAQFSNEPWLKFAYQGKILFVAKKPFRYSLSWNAINAANAVYGDRTVTIGGLTYKVRLMRGANKDPADAYEGSICHGSEWNRLMLPIHENAPNNWAYPNNVDSPTEDWGVNYTDEDLLTHYNYGNGSRSWCQEVAETASLRVRRGGYGVSSSGSITASNSSSGYGWRPVLELL
jgi:hypothetical protein